LMVPWRGLYFSVTILSPKCYAFHTALWFNLDRRVD
jgi:hypothetical protein